MATVGDSRGIIDMAGEDIFAAAVDAIVNPVNCLGVMGKGLALAFKQRYPHNYAVYRDACQQKAVQPGNVLVVLLGGHHPRYVVNFPTKWHWRDPSRMEYIDSGLDDLARIVSKLRIKSIAIPALGCGLGGLSWSDVRPKIVEHLAPTGARILLYPPQERTSNGQR